MVKVKYDKILGKLREGGEGGEGTSDYTDLENKPSINGVELDGNKTSSDLGLATASQGAKADTALQPKQSGQYTNGNMVMFDDNGGLVDSGKRAIDFITKSVNDLTNYYLKSETYTKAEVAALIAAIQQFHYEIYAKLPASGESNVLYLIGPIGTGTDRYEEYVYTNNAWTKIGDTSIDLSGYVTTSALNTALADYTTTASLTTLLAGKQDTISDLSTIRSGAAAGATAVQPNTLNDYVQKSVTSGLLKNDGTVDSQTADKAASALQPTGVKTINNQSIVGSGNITIEGSGTDDYTDLDNKPQINSVTLSGNKSASDLGLATASQGAKADTAVQQVTVGTTTTGTAGSNASVTNSGTATNPILDFTIPRGADGADGQDGADAVNPFKGWYVSANALPANPVIGDYAYVKGASSTDPAAIYECTTAGTWSDSGRTVDTSNVQTFETGEEVNEVGIDNAPTAGSDNLVKSGGVYSSTPSVSNSATESDLDISDEQGNVLVRFAGGNLRVRNFSSVDALESIQNLNTRIDNVEDNMFMPKGILLDTDWWTDVDDAVAIRCLLWAERCGLVDLVGVCVDAVNSTSGKSIAAFLNEEGRGGLAIGMDKQATDYNGNPPYHSTCINNWAYYDNILSNDNCEDCVSFYRRALVNSSKKLDIICIGYGNALQRLLNSTSDNISPLTGRELILEKINKLWWMAGNYPNGSENNFNRTSRSRAAGADICTNWPTPIVFLGFEVGQTVISGDKLSTDLNSNDLLYKCLVAHGSGNGRSSWDPMTVLLACYDNLDIAGYTTVQGINSVNSSTGGNTFTVNNQGKHYYVVKKYADWWYAHQINTIISLTSWPSRKLGTQQIDKL